MKKNEKKAVPVPESSLAKYRMEGGYGEKKLVVSAEAMRKIDEGVAP